MPVDLIAYAAVAAILFVMLFRVLGTRQEGDITRPNPFAESYSKTPEAQGLTAVPSSSTPLSDSAPAQVMFQIALIDKRFDAKTFLTNAQTAYKMVVEAYGKGDRRMLADLLSPPVLDTFMGAIAAREARGERQDLSVQSIAHADIKHAALNGQTARITATFTADHIRVTRNNLGDIIDGTEERTVRVIDVWTFERDLKSNDPRWWVVETADDDDSDGPL